jgi:hypothetical protein
MSISLNISPKIIPSIATLYNEVNRVFLEYIDNSLDSAESYYDTENNRYTRSIEVVIAIKGKSYRDGKVIIYDNCFGITNFTKVVESIGDSDKKTNAFTNGQFGYGIYSFLSHCSNMIITSKIKGSSPNSIPIDKKDFDAKHQKDVKFDLKTKSLLVNQRIAKLLGRSDIQKDLSGTVVELSCFKNSSWRDIDPNELKDEIEKHFEFLLLRQNLSITIVEKGKKYTCKPFDYNQFPGEIWEDKIEELSSTRYKTKYTFRPKQPIQVFIKITKGQEIKKAPIFISKGRRIAEIKDIKSFKSKNKSNLWDHPNVTGFIDLIDFLPPTIARTDFRNSAKSKALYDKLIELEPLILEEVRRVNRASEESHYRQLEDRLNKALTKLARLDAMNYRKQYVSGDEVNLEGGSSGIGLEPDAGMKDKTGDVPITPGHSSDGPIEGDGYGPGDISGNEPGGSETGAEPLNKLADNPFEDSEFKGKERKRSGFNIKIDSGDPIIDAATDQPMRSELFGSEIRIYQQHPDFKERVKGFRSGKQKITQRLITYLAGEITVHYKDKFHNKMGQPEYNKSMFSGLVSFIYQFESMLSDLVNTNLSDLSG